MTTRSTQQFHASEAKWRAWPVHDPDRPAPPRVDPSKAGPPAPMPADAVVLFDGQDVAKWQALRDWKVADGCLPGVRGIRTLESAKTVSPIITTELIELSELNLDPYIAVGSKSSDRPDDFPPCARNWTPQMSSAS